jgi:hypothetical protein
MALGRLAPSIVCALVTLTMSDREGGSGGVPPTDEDLSLPKATVAKMITGMRSADASVSFFIMLLPCTDLLPNDVTCAKETRDLVIECCVGEFYVTRRTSVGSLTVLLSSSRVYTPYIVRGQRDM